VGALEPVLAFGESHSSRPAWDRVASMWDAMLAPAGMTGAVAEAARGMVSSPLAIDRNLVIRGTHKSHATLFYLSAFFAIHRLSHKLSL